MPVPGASTASALVVCFAGFTGWCTWRQNCVEDSLVAPPVSWPIAGTFDLNAQTSRVGELFTVNASPRDVVSLAVAHKQEAPGNQLDVRTKVLNTGEFDAGQVSHDVGEIASPSDIGDSRLGTFATYFIGCAVFADLILLVTCLTLACSFLLSWSRQVNPEQANSGHSNSSMVRPTFAQAPAQLPQNAADFLDEWEIGIASGMWKLPVQQPVSAPPSGSPCKDDALQAQINAILESRTQHRKQSEQSPAPCTSDDVQNKAMGKPWKQSHAQCEQSPPMCSLHGDLKTQIDAVSNWSMLSGEQREQSVAPCTSHDQLKEKVDAIVGLSAEHRKQPFIVPCSSDDKLKARINAIMAVHAEHRKKDCEQSPAPFSSDDDLRRHINTIVAARAECPKLSGQPPKVACTDDQLKSQINEIVRSHKQTLASPSPAKSVSDTELAFQANLALSAAKERNTPAKFPSSLSVQWSPQWDSYDEVYVQPCQLDFAADENDDAMESQKNEAEEIAFNAEEDGVVSTGLVEPGSTLTIEADAESLHKQKAEACPFVVSQIPSPTRNRSKRLLAALQAPAEQACPISDEFQTAMEDRMVAPSPDTSSNARPDKRSSRGGAMFRMLRNSATPSKGPGEKVLHGGASHPEEVEASGVASPDAVQWQ